MNEAQIKVLQMIQNGIISAEEADQLLHALGEDAEFKPTPDGTPGAVADVAVDDEQAPSGETHYARTGPPPVWQGIWFYVFAGAVTLTALGIGFTMSVAQDRAHPAWLICTLPLLIFGALLAGLTWWSRSARWMHLKVRDEEHRINFALPVPLHLAGWLTRLARPWVPQLRDTAVDEALMALADASTGGEEMLIVEVDDQDQGEQVEIRFG